MKSVDIKESTINELITHAESLTELENAAKADCDQLEKDLIAADKVHAALKREAALVRKLGVALLKTSDPEKQQVIRVKFLARIQAAQVERSAAEVALEKSRALVTEAVEQLQDVVQQVAERVKSQEGAPVQ